MDIRFTNIESLLKRLKAAEHIHIQNINQIDPVGVAILKQYKVSNPEVTVRASGECFDYIEQLLEESYDPIHQHLPVIHFDDHTNNIDELKSILTHKIIDHANNLSPDKKEDLPEYLEYMISEMMGNVISHAQSVHGGFVTAQYYPEKKKVQVVIIDGGVGFLSTLSTHHTVENEAEAIQKALEKEVTGSNVFSPYNNAPKHAGLGLFFLSKIIEYTQGKLIIISNHTIYRYPENSFTEIKTAFKGSVVSFEIYIDNLDNDFATVFNRIGYDEEDDEDVF